MCVCACMCVCARVCVCVRTLLLLRILAVVSEHIFQICVLFNCWCFIVKCMECFMQMMSQKANFSTQRQ